MVTQVQRFHVFRLPLWPAARRTGEDLRSLFRDDLSALSSSSDADLEISLLQFWNATMEIELFLGFRIRC